LAFYFHIVTSCSALLTKHYSGDQIKKNEKGDHVECMEERRGAYRVLMGKPGGKRPLGRPRCRKEYNIKMYLQEI